MSTRLSEAGYQPRTINSMLAQLHDLLVFAEKVDDDYVLKGKLEHIAVEKQTKYYTPEQLSAIDSFQPAKETHGIMQMILMFIYESGVSQVDLAYLTQDNITLDKEGNEYLYFHRQKTSGLSVVHLTETARQLLALMQPFVSIYHRFRKQQDVSRHLIPMPKKDSTYAYLSQISKELGFSVTLHPMRHNFAMRQLNDYGRSIEAVSRMLGHISVSTTEQEYAFVTEVRVHKEISKLNNYTSYEKSQNKGSQG